MILSWLQQHLWSSETIHRECRRCGTTVASETECCPSCGHTEIAVYDIP